MIYRFIAQHNNTFYSAICDGSVITHFRFPFPTLDISEVFNNSAYKERDEDQIDNIPHMLKNTKATNHILISIDLTYSQFLEQYPEWIL